MCSPNNWGQYDDALVLVTMMKLSYFIITAIDGMFEGGTQRRGDWYGWKNSWARGYERVLIFFCINSHYGIGMPI